MAYYKRYSIFRIRTNPMDRYRILQLFASSSRPHRWFTLLLCGYGMKSYKRGSDWRQSRNQQLLRSLRESIVDKPPYINAVSEHLLPPQLPNEEGFHEAFKTLLENPEFVAEGGTLAFGLRHVCPIERDLKHVYNVLKWSDAVVYQNVRALGFEPVLYVSPNSSPTSVIVDQLSGLYNAYIEESISQIIQREQDGGVGHARDGATVYNRQKEAFACYEDESLTWEYGDVCMIARIGKAGDRPTYPTVAQVKKVYQGQN
ncbi:hypothetical protein F5888DRAFT_1630847 [Russula emetica]|nr:hypothetical protein F5888DRAFT_1630847 [Russula emetica]